jgi:hypothetical protein
MKCCYNVNERLSSIQDDETPLNKKRDDFFLIEGRTSRPA